MKRSLLVMGVVAAMLVTASSAFAAGVNLAWTSCATLGGASNRTFACATNATPNNFLEGTFVLPNDVAQVSAAEVVLDLDSQQATLPSWWELKFVGACRQNSLTIQAYNGDGASCTDWAQGLASMNLASYVVSGQDIPPGGLGPNTARIKIVNAVDPTALQDLLGNTEYGVFQLTVNNAKTVGTGACAGCTNPVCIVLNSVLMTTSGNLNNTFMGTGTSPGSNIVTWQGAGADCNAVPVRNTSWGQVKALYR
jgi:hypothetical protein